MKDYIAVDVDGHIMEPPDLFENNLEPKYRDRAYKLVLDDQGVEHPVMDNVWLDDTRPVGTVSVYGAVDKPMEDYLAGKVHYRDSMVPGAWVPEERLKVMDQEGIDIALFYPSLGLDWESSSNDADLVAAHCRVYNDWLIDFCSTDPSRLVPIAHVSFMDVEQAVAETRRVAGLGAKGLMLLAFPPRNGSPYGEPMFDPIWAEAASLGLPVGVHVHGGGTRFGGDYFYPHPWKASWWWWFVTAAEFVVDTMTSLFQGGLFDRFPNLQVIALEAGCGWLAYWLERMDEYFERYGFQTSMQLKPSEYFNRQCWISMEPSEKIGLTMMQLLGADRFLWASDYPHSDAEMGTVVQLKKNLAPAPGCGVPKDTGRECGQAVSAWVIRHNATISGLWRGRDEWFRADASLHKVRGCLCRIHPYPFDGLRAGSSPLTSRDIYITLGVEGRDTPPIPLLRPFDSASRANGLDLRPWRWKPNSGAE